MATKILHVLALLVAMSLGYYVGLFVGWRNGVQNDYVSGLGVANRNVALLERLCDEVDCAKSKAAGGLKSAIATDLVILNGLLTYSQSAAATAILASPHAVIELSGKPKSERLSLGNVVERARAAGVVVELPSVGR